METKIYEGQANIYNPATSEIIRRRTWRDKFTQEQVLEWMNQREKFLREFDEYDEITWMLWDDGCYRMTAYRYEKKSKRGRTLKQKAVCYIFKPIA